MEPNEVQYTAVECDYRVIDASKRCVILQHKLGENGRVFFDGSLIGKSPKNLRMFSYDIVDHSLQLKQSLRPTHNVVSRKYVAVLRDAVLKSTAKEVQALKQSIHEKSKKNARRNATKNRNARMVHAEAELSSGQSIPMHSTNVKPAATIAQTNKLTNEVLSLFAQLDVIDDAICNVRIVEEYQRLVHFRGEVEEIAAVCSLLLDADQ
jgi:hypothetical protein